MVKFDLKFLGAAQTVTGSSFILSIKENGDNILNIMVDHGMFQGPDVEKNNYDSYNFDPREIDLLLVTHAHIDHCGRIPRLFDNGFKGDILCTSETADLLELILFDSAKVQKIKKQNDGIEILYDANSVSMALENISTIDFDVDYEYSRKQVVNSKTLDKSQGTITFKAYRAGHVLGASSYQISYKDKSITFSGDIGRSSQVVVNQFDKTPKSSNYIVMESLYGDKLHGDIDSLLDNFAKAVTKVIKRNGNVIVPSFSMQRSQELIVVLNKLISEKKIPDDVQIIFDSPLALKITDVYTSNPDEINYPSLGKFKDLNSAIFTKHVKVVKNYGLTKRIYKQTKKIIISGSGMCTGGKVLGYLKHMIQDPKNMISIVGFQAEETLGAEIISGAKKVEIDDEMLNVNAEVEVFKGFSAHADRGDLLDWLGNFDKEQLSDLFLIHAMPSQSQSFTHNLDEVSKGSSIYIPKRYDTFEL